MRQPHPATPRFPLKGYLLINGIVWLLLLLIYLATKGGWFSTVAPTIQRPGVSPVLLLVGFAFLLASAYDFLFDRFRSRAFRSADDEHPAGDAPDPAPASAPGPKA